MFIRLHVVLFPAKIRRKTK